MLESLLVKDYGGNEDLLLGELQFSFIAFLVLGLLAYNCIFYLYYLKVFELITRLMWQMGQSLEAFFQWKAIVSLLFGCTDAVSYIHELRQLYVGLCLVYTSLF